MKWIEYLSRTEVAQKYYTVDGNVDVIKGVTYDREPYMTFTTPLWRAT